ncbi:MAG: hypothetical protein ACK5FF_21815, partial [Planctomyces sp.]
VFIRGEKNVPDPCPSVAQRHHPRPHCHVTSALSVALRSKNVATAREIAVIWRLERLKSSFADAAGP